MKLLTCIIIAAMTVAAKAQDKRSLREIYELSEDIGALEIFDLPKRQLEGKPADIFGDNRISGVVVISEYSGPRNIIRPIAQSFIDLVRSENSLSAVPMESPGTVIGMVRLTSGECVLVRRSESQIILQFRGAWGALKRRDFPNILGITARLKPPNAEQDGADQPATAPESKSGGNKSTNPQSEAHPQ